MKLVLAPRWILSAPLGLTLAATALAGCSDDTTSRDDGAATGIDSGPDSGNEDEANTGDEDTSDTTTTGDGDTTTTTTTTTDSGDGDSGPSKPPKFDVAAMPDSPNICLVPDHLPCDHLDYPNEKVEAIAALGLNCPGEFQADAEVNGHYLGTYVHEGTLGDANPATYPVLEGTKMVILSTGDALDVTTPGAEGDTSLPQNDPGNLPAPLTHTKVSDTETCEENEALIGMGDCSNTIYDQFANTAGAFDYSEIRFSIQVPVAVSGFAYNVAFLSWEYPDFYQWPYNDMYVAWLVSEEWTGNITFDEQGNPLSLNAGFLDFKDAPNIYDCAPPCEAPELSGTGLEGHGGTKWLETNVGVNAEEEITVVFAIFDIQDNIVDSAVLLDNFRWTCFGGTPGTVVG